MLSPNFQVLYQGDAHEFKIIFPNGGNVEKITEHFQSTPRTLMPQMKKQLRPKTN
jgi:hypothetical protein